MGASTTGVVVLHQQVMGAGRWDKTAGIPMLLCVDKGHTTTRGVLDAVAVELESRLGPGAGQSGWTLYRGEGMNRMPINHSGILSNGMKSAAMHYMVMTEKYRRVSESKESDMIGGFVPKNTVVRALEKKVLHSGVERVRFSFCGVDGWLSVRELTGEEVLRPVESAEVEDFVLQPRERLTVLWHEGVTLPRRLSSVLEAAKVAEPICRHECVDLAQCFRWRNEREDLAGADEVYCPRCKAHCEASKELAIWGPPPVLVIQLKRFKYSAVARERLDQPVDFPLEDLNIDEFCLSGEGSQGGARYDLAAFSVHIGGLHSGHYKAYARSSETGQWYCFDDERVCAVETDEVKERGRVGGYVFFYVRRTAVM